MKIILSYLFLLLFPALTFCDWPEPYNSIWARPFDNHGWFHETNQNHIIRIIDSNHAENAIEVGSWLGLSSRFIAKRISGKLYCVDTWAPDEEVYQTDKRLPYLYHQFLSNVIHEALCEKIVPIRMKSVEAANSLHIIADLIYIDADHDTESVTKDILHWYGHLSEKGVICGDDWAFLPVQTAVLNCANHLGRKVKFENNFWWFE